MGTTNARLSPWCLEEISSLRSQEDVRLGLRGAKYVRVRGLGMAAVSGGVEHEHGHMGVTVLTECSRRVTGCRHGGLVQKGGTCHFA